MTSCLRRCQDLLLHQEAVRTNERESCLLKLSLHQGGVMALSPISRKEQEACCLTRSSMCCAGQPRSALTKLRGKVATGTLEGAGLSGSRTQGDGQLSACWAQGVPSPPQLLTNTLQSKGPRVPGADEPGALPESHQEAPVSRLCPSPAQRLRSTNLSSTWLVRHPR